MTGQETVRAAAPAAARIASGALIGAGAVAAAGAAAAAWGRFVELNRFRIREETLPVLPAGSPELRVLHVSDLHMIPGQARKTAFVRSLAELEPDLVLNTGDNFSHPDALEPLLEALDPLLDFPGAYVPGSNCYFAPQLKNPARYLWEDTSRENQEKARRNSREDPENPAVLPFRQMHEAFDSRGWQGMANRTGRIDVGGVRLDFSGVDDPHLGYDRHPGFEASAYDQSDGPALRIGIMHAPYLRTLHRFVADGAQVMFAGHTHGGQICLPGGRAVVSNCDLPPARAKGVSFEGTTPLNVSAGLGTSRFAPVRLFCPPEAVLVRLVPQG